MGLAKTFLALGIAIIFVFFFGYFVHVFFGQSFSERMGYNGDDMKDCTAKYSSCATGNRTTTEMNQCRDNRTRCIADARNKSLTLSEPRTRQSFYILFAIGIAAIVAGIFLSSIEGIGSGLIGGGVLTILWSLIYSYQYWVDLNRYLKLTFLGVVLVLLIYLGYKKIEQKKRSSEEIKQQVSEEIPTETSPKKRKVQKGK